MRTIPTANGNIVRLTDEEYKKAEREKRLVITASSHLRTLLPERKPFTAGST